MLEILNWDHLNVNISPEEFVSADDNLTTCELRTVQKILAKATSGTAEDSDYKDT